ncbi:hypothetical protein M569_16210 [Genlisea aurea]|uniref:Uncharacterized protein n=1 Tax=Genlisea aurea TaxID=192259 RepID=S8BVH2_9LAMI|nr:hypothetical protein M569_16210 [Genlisea aurea]
MAASASSVPLFLLLPSSSSSSSKPSISIQIRNPTPRYPHTKPHKISKLTSHLINNRSSSFRCRAEKEYKFPDPIPEFADAETEKFRTHLASKLSKKEDIFGDSVDEVVEICTNILQEFLRTEYGGPGTLLVMPFIDMADALNERGLPGGPQAARAAVKWAQKCVDNDWKQWTAAA